MPISDKYRSNLNFLGKKCNPQNLFTKISAKPASYLGTYHEGKSAKNVIQKMPIKSLQLNILQFVKIYGFHSSNFILEYNWKITTFWADPRGGGGHFRK